MTIQINNVLTRQKSPFTPLEDNTVRIYVCGVTVYGRCHVGHLRCYLSFDAIVRYFAYKGYNVAYCRNFTDIDDKIIARAKEIEAGPEGEWRQAAAYADYDDAQWQTRLAEDDVIRNRAKADDRHLAEVVSDYFIDIFSNDDFGPFDLFPATSEPRVSQNIPEVIALIEQIIDNGYGYESCGDVYFDVAAYHEKTGQYGKLSGRDFKQMMDGARVAPGDKKRNAPDFALWKSAATGDPAWPSPWGDGRPGWHIECSAMSHKELGTPFDIHGGGKDLIFPHHENEIAQSEAGLGHAFCNTWIHNGFVTVDGVKMSKSLGNFISIQEALKMAPPEVWRMVVLGTHYASPIDFSRTRKETEGDETVRGTIDIAFDRVEYFYETLKRADEAVGADPISDDATVLADERGQAIIDTFEKMMDDDFNTARAMAVIGESMKYVNELCDMKAKQIKKLDGGKESWRRTLQKAATDLRVVLGALNLCKAKPEEALAAMRDFSAKARGIDAAKVEQLMLDRAEARKEKDWARSDEIRDALAAMGVELRDGVGGSDWKVARN
ncbi:MAG: cysteine--tRNA ligase [Deltaproteobacteria bacterium]|nr:cysteine--tRNA ligase [Deltaproteobacteria bacterium]